MVLPSRLSWRGDEAARPVTGLLLAPRRRDTARTMSQENVEIIRRAFEAFNGGNRAAFLSFYDDDIVLHIAPPSIDAGSYYGAEEVERQYTRMFAPFGETYRVEIEDLIDAGDSVVVCSRPKGRGRRSGAAVEGPPGWGVFTMRAGRIIRIDHPADRAEALEAVGLSE
jgi:ketosteroid isomerase-like protein